MSNDPIDMKGDISASPLYSEDLAPVPMEKRTWSVWSLAALWVGMAVCIPTYMLASNIILQGISWLDALLIIGLANLIITIPMVLSGHAGVKYGIPFPVLGRSSFGHNGIHIPAIIRGLIAAVWFGIQTWIGGISIYSLWCAFTGQAIITSGYTEGQFVGFFIFWLINVYFIWKGTESIKWLEIFAAPILIIMGILLIIWGSNKVGGFDKVLEQGVQLQHPSVVLTNSQENPDELELRIQPVKGVDGGTKAKEYQVQIDYFEVPEDNNVQAQIAINDDWLSLNEDITKVLIKDIEGADKELIMNGKMSLYVQLRAQKEEDIVYSSKKQVLFTPASNQGDTGSIWPFLVMLTAMVGFWATMSISIADITRYSKTQKEQVAGQFIGLPGTMILYSFVGIFVTCASVVVFDDVLIRADAPWDPAALLAKFKEPAVVIVSQIFLIIATLSTNIAANVIAPANAFANAMPRKISFRTGGLITAVIGIIICPWWIINHIVPFLLFVSSLLGPVVAILICDYFLIRKTELKVADLFKTNGEYAFGGSGFNQSAMIAFVAGVFAAGIGRFVPSLSFLYDLSWFSGFIVSFFLYWVMMRRKVQP